MSRLWTASMSDSAGTPFMVEVEKDGTKDEEKEEEGREKERQEKEEEEKDRDLGELNKELGLLRRE